MAYELDFQKPVKPEDVAQAVAKELQKSTEKEVCIIECEAAPLYTIFGGKVCLATVCPVKGNEPQEGYINFIVALTEEVGEITDHPDELVDRVRKALSS